MGPHDFTREMKPEAAAVPILILTTKWLKEAGAEAPWHARSVVDDVDRPPPHDDLDLTFSAAVSNSVADEVPERPAQRMEISRHFHRMRGRMQRQLVARLH